MFTYFYEQAEIGSGATAILPGVLYKLVVRLLERCYDKEMKTFVSQEIYVRNISETVAFLVDTFGFEIEYQQSDFANIWSGQTRLILNELKLEEFALPNPILKEGALGYVGCGSELVFSVSDLDGVYSRLTNTIATKITEIHTQSWGLRDFRFLLPDGHYIRVTEPDERIQSIWSVDR